jgi:O-antigen/teichoic acid export membrane protein
MYYVWHIPFYALGTVALRTLIAMRMAHIAVIGSAINLVVNVVTNTVAVPRIGVEGVALATTAMYAASFAFLTAMVTSELRKRRALREM